MKERSRDDIEVFLSVDIHIAFFWVTVTYSLICGTAALKERTFAVFGAS
jgi:hypothetical protein